MLRFAISVVTILATAPATAEEKRIASGAGVSTCKQFLEDYAAEPSRTIFTFFSWAQGFMTAQNIITANSNKTYRSLEGTIEQQQEFLQKYCKEYPDHYFSSAVTAMYNLMPLKNLK